MTEDLYNSIRGNFHRVLDRVEKSAISVGRAADSVKLVVVTKGHPIEIARTVVKAGAKYLGENYVEDAIPKIAQLADENIEWHMIGHVQSRKARLVSENFAWVHSVDRMKIARRLNNFSAGVERVTPVLLECNVSSETTKFGWPSWSEEHWPELAEELGSLIELPNISVRGLMTMPPYDPDQEKSRPYFIKLRRLRDYLNDRFTNLRLMELSMGMSNDFEVAIEEGATIIRVGTAIVGERSA